MLVKTFEIFKTNQDSIQDFSFNSSDKLQPDDSLNHDNEINMHFSQDQIEQINTSFKNLPEDVQFSPKQLTTEQFYEKLKTQTCNYIRAAVDLFEQAPKSPAIEEKMHSLSISLCQTFLSSLITESTTLNTKLKEPIIPIPIQKATSIESIVQMKKTTISSENRKSLEIDHRYIFENEDFLSLDEILQRLNLEAAALGYKFYRGSTNKKAGYSYCYCKYRFKETEFKEDNDKEKTSDPLKKRIVCPAYYSFKKQNEFWALNGSNLFHTHSGIDIEDLTPSIKQDLSYL